MLATALRQLDRLLYIVVLFLDVTIYSKSQGTLPIIKIRHIDNWVVVVEGLQYAECTPVWCYNCFLCTTLY